MFVDRAQHENSHGACVQTCMYIARTHRGAHHFTDYSAPVHMCYKKALRDSAALRSALKLGAHTACIRAIADCSRPVRVSQYVKLQPGTRRERARKI